MNIFSEKWVKDVTRQFIKGIKMPIDILKGFNPTII